MISNRLAMKCLAKEIGQSFMTRKMELLLIELRNIVGGARLAEIGMEDHEFGFWYVDSEMPIVDLNGGLE